MFIASALSLGSHMSDSVSATLSHLKMKINKKRGGVEAIKVSPMGGFGGWTQTWPPMGHESDLVQ